MNLELDPDNETQVALDAKIRERREINANRVRGLEEMGVPIDPSDAKFTHHFAWLVHIGVMTLEQFMEMELDWENTFGVQLKAMTADVKERVSAIEAEMRRRQAAQRLGVGPQGGGLLLPNGQVMPVGQTRPEAAAD